MQVTSISYKGKPEFIPRELFRAYLKPGKLNQLFRAGGMLPSSLIKRWEREGRPLKSIDAMYRPIDVIAKARSLNMSIEREKVEQVRFDLEKAKAELESLRSEIDAKRHEITMDEISHSLSSKILLKEHEIVAEKRPFASKCGVYFLIKEDRVVYVGQSVNVFARVSAHFKTKDFDSFTYTILPPHQLDAAESLYIHALRPEQNGRLNDGMLSAPLSLQDLMSLKRQRIAIETGGLHG